MLKQEELKQVIELGKSYRYNELCDLINEQQTKAQNKKKEQLDDWARFFDYDVISKYEYVINEIYDAPSTGFENGFFYKTIYIPVKCSKQDYEYLNKCREWAGDCWNAIVKADQECQDKNQRLMTRSELQDFVKDITPLHANGNQHVFVKYYDSRDAMFSSIKAKHKNSHKVKLPYKEKKHYIVGWNQFSFTIDYYRKELRLSKKSISNGDFQTPVICTFKTMPRFVVEIELIYKDGLYFVIKYKEPKVNDDVVSDNVSAIDLGEIHSITSI